MIVVLGLLMGEETRDEEIETMALNTYSTSCLATISLSLRDKNHALIEAPRLSWRLSGVAHLSYWRFLLMNILVRRPRGFSGRVSHRIFVM